MIKEAYCSFEVAKLLKEKGFDVSCIGRYSVRSKEFHLDGTKMCNNGGLFEYAASTHQMAMAWLREVHKINIEIHYNRFGENYKYLIIYKPEVLDDIRSLGVYFHYEEAVEAALKYVLENLI